MEDELLADNTIVYIEKKIFGNFTMEMITDEFYLWKIVVRHDVDVKCFFFFFVGIFVYVYSELDSFCMFINV